MELAGLPLHPLVVHLVVGLVPLSALLSIAFAVVPRWRWLVRWPAVATVVGAVAATWVGRLSGEALLEARPFLLDGDPLRSQVQSHQQLGELLSLAVLPFAAAVLFAAWSLPGESPLVSGRGAQGSRLPAADRVLPVLVVGLALTALVLVVLAGDAGARAVWG
jgi:uncharacterized membrane protein